MWKYVSGYLKAHVAAIATAVSLAMSDLANSGAISANDWYAIIGAALGAGLVIAAVPNSGPEAPTPGA